MTSYRFTAERIFAIIEKIADRLDLVDGRKFNNLHGDERAALDIMMNELNGDIEQWEYQSIQLATRDSLSSFCREWIEGNPQENYHTHIAILWNPQPIGDKK